MAERIQLGNRDYQSLYNILRAYRRAGGHSDTITDKFNRFDNPSTFYFRIFFDFHKGLIDCSHDLAKTSKPTQDTFWDRDVYIANSALNYLMINNEWERADLLRDFINLLSNINTNSPWYFTELEGLGEILNRTEYTTESFVLPEVKTMNTKCLPDAYDNRIGTLIDLYRTICYSQQLHKEIVPANLRRFDMYVYIFPANTRGIHTIHKYREDSVGIESKEPAMGKFATYDQNFIHVDTMNGNVENTGDKYITSSKLIYLRDCEIDLNASISGYTGVKNDEGFAQEYTIPIKVRTAMEQRYNEFLMIRIGDFIIADMDLPNANSDSAGNLRTTYWDADTANQISKLKSADNRLEKKNLMAGVDVPNPNTPAEYESYTTFAKSHTLGTNRYRDQNKTSSSDPWLNKGDKSNSSLLTPWLNIGEQKSAQIAGQVKQVVDAGKSALGSWTDINRLNQSLANGADSLINRLVWGNIFETNLQDITTNISSFTAGLSSNSVIDRSTRKGWSHESRKSPSRADQLGGNQADYSNNPNGNFMPETETPSGNIFG